MDVFSLSWVLVGMDVYSLFMSSMLGCRVHNDANPMYHVYVLFFYCSLLPWDDVLPSSLFLTLSYYNPDVNHMFPLPDTALYWDELDGYVPPCWCWCVGCSAPTPHDCSYLTGLGGKVIFIMCVYLCYIHGLECVCARKENVELSQVIHYSRPSMSGYKGGWMIYLKMWKRVKRG
jgi:hypothetical protein